MTVLDWVVTFGLFAFAAYCAVMMVKILTMSDENERAKIRAQQDPNRSNMSRKIAKHLIESGYVDAPLHVEDHLSDWIFRKDTDELCYVVRFRARCFGYQFSIGRGCYKTSYEIPEIMLLHVNDLAKAFKRIWDLLEKEFADISKAPPLSGISE